MTTTTRTGTVEELADAFVVFLETGVPPEGLFADDAFCDFTMPQWRLQAVGRDALVAMRRHSHPGIGTVPRRRLDATPTGFVLELEERWHGGGEDWYCREMFRADVADGAITELSVYCTGDWDGALQRRHAREVHLPRP
ncbi:hypothetical protein [Kitasatospora sp. NPDC059571]|uniref:hypothetical protein n=1 Tax=Kitasatospora sp. NPDC059571 TaxID=3346871 RepID=UPI0036AF59F6